MVNGKCETLQECETSVSGTLHETSITTSKQRLREIRRKFGDTHGSVTRFGNSRFGIQDLARQILKNLEM